VDPASAAPWALLTWVVRAVFRRDPVAFGMGCCRLAISILGLGLAQQAREDWGDEILGDIEMSIWEWRKVRVADEQIGSQLVWEALRLLATGWSSRAHYAQTAAVRQEVDESDALFLLDTSLADSELVYRVLRNGAAHHVHLTSTELRLLRVLALRAAQGDRGGGPSRASG